MILLRVVGGLGNQMFQYAYGHSLALKFNQELFFDLSWYNAGSKREFGLYQWNIPTCHVLNSIKCQKIRLVCGSLTKQNRLGSNRIGNIFYKYLFYPDWVYLIEKEPGYYDEIERLPAFNIYLDGYFQNKNYFNNIREILLKEFVPSTDLNNNEHGILDEINNYEESVCIHVRRGDYFSDSKTNNAHGVCTPSYFMRAIEIINQEVENPFFYVFSDDPEWCLNHINFPSNVSIVSPQISLDSHEIFVMSKCKHYIISNSTFGWWAEWLNKSTDKIKIAPSIWFRNSLNSMSGLFDNSWRRLHP